jgi:small subunit ribosomal protein S6
LREYETVFVLHPTYEEKEFEAEIQAVSDLITASGGSIIEVDRWGRRRLAYDIKKVHEGIYTLLRYKSDPGVLKDIERRFRMNERMLRYMTVISEGPLAPPRAEGGSDGPGTGERSSSGAALDVSGASDVPLPVVAPVEASVQAPITQPAPADDTPAEPADGASL